MPGHHTGHDFSPAFAGSGENARERVLEDHRTSTSPLPCAPSHADYKVGWICALPTEVTAAAFMLDECYSMLNQPSNDHNSYILGRMGSHYVAIASLPVGVMGVASAARVAAQMTTTFPSLQYRFMVGIGGGVPSSQHDIRLGDVVVSKPVGDLGGVVQYDFGKTVQEGRFVRQGALNRPPTRLLSAASTMQTQLDLGHSYISGILAQSAYRHPQREKACTFLGASRDQLFKSSYSHPATNATCKHCDRTQLVNRAPRPDTRPVVHYGIIASANQVMRDGATRERLRQELDVLCFEMEAAGLMDDFPCLVVRGICDYADSHKNKEWQDYAASTAAAFTKALLGEIAGDICPPPPNGTYIHSLCHQSTIELISLVGKAMANTGLSDILDLSAKHGLKDGVDSFWDHLTVSGLDLYRKIWERLPKTDGRYVQYDVLVHSFASSPGPLAKSIHAKWSVLLKAWRIHEKVGSETALFPRNLICALLYMLHVKLHYPKQAFHSRSDKNIQISWQRWQLITRFDVWIPCSCKDFGLNNCQREWNFGIKDRLCRGPSRVPCVSLQVGQGLHAVPSSMGQMINKDNGIRFFSVRCQQFPIQI